MTKRLVNGMELNVPDGVLVFEQRIADGYPFLLYRRRPILPIWRERGGPSFHIHITGKDWMSMNTLAEAMRWCDSNPLPERKSA